MKKVHTNGAEAKSLDVSFTHPRSSKTYEATVVASGTVGECLEALIAEGFLGAETDAARYLVTLERTKETLARDATFADAGVAAGDVISISISGKAGA